MLIINIKAYSIRNFGFSQEKVSIFLALSLVGVWGAKMAPQKLKIQLEITNCDFKFWKYKTVLVLNYMSCIKMPRRRWRSSLEKY